MTSPKDAIGPARQAAMRVYQRARAVALPEVRRVLHRLSGAWWTARDRLWPSRPASGGRVSPRSLAVLERLWPSHPAGRDLHVQVTSRPRILVWATHMQTDVLALTLHLDSLRDVDLMVVMRDLPAYLGERIARARPFRCVTVDRADPEAEARARAFLADVVICDNHLPDFPAAPRLAYLWHGLGWKARARSAVDTFHRDVRRLTGADGRGPNPRLLVQCYGQPDRQWRIAEWGLHPQVCPILGMAFSDLFLNPPYDREALASLYRIDVLRRPTVLLSLTWHYGGVFAREATVDRMARRSLGGDYDSGDDLSFVEKVLHTAHQMGANLLMCLHDRNRYARRYLEALHGLAARYPHVEVKHKDEHPDNLPDLLVADVMVSNLSSFITYFYLSGKPAIHVNPVKGDPGDMLLSRLFFGRVGFRRAGESEPVFMTRPEDNGGVLVHTAQETTDALVKALTRPEAFEGLPGAFLTRHVHGIDGHTAERFEQSIRLLLSGRLHESPLLDSRPGVRDDENA